MPTPPSQDEVLGYFDALSNWGRWGDDDLLGTLNTISAEKRKQAAALVQDGESVSCSRLITRQHSGALEGSNPAIYMVQAGERFALGAKGSVIARRRLKSGVVEDDTVPLQWCGEIMTFNQHGMIFTHIDGLAHIAFRNQYYNGRDIATTTATDGATVQTSDCMRDGILTRGILYDIARLKGKDWLDADEHVYPEDLEAFEREHNVRAEPGDVILLRTGYGLQVLNAWEIGEGPPGEHSGWGTACLPWFRERDVAMLGCDSINEAMPAGYELTLLPVHEVALVALGLRVIENCDFERLAQLCADKNRWEFSLSVNALRIENGTGSPVNPIATF